MPCGTCGTWARHTTDDWGEHHPDCPEFWKMLGVTVAETNSVVTYLAAGPATATELSVADLLARRREFEARRRAIDASDRGDA